MKDDSVCYYWKVEIMECKQFLFLGNETERDKKKNQQPSNLKEKKVKSIVHES